VNTTSVQSAFSTTHRYLELGYDAPSRSSVVEPSVDDPVNDTGLGPQRGDLQLSDKFACLVKLICEGSGEFS
jgi:hypothetical protein